CRFCCVRAAGDVCALSLHDALPISLYQGWVLWYLRRLVRGWAAISAATDAILSGQTDVHLEADKMPRALRDHARQLNDLGQAIRDRKSTRLNSSHVSISYAVFCLKK